VIAMMNRIVACLALLLPSLALAQDWKPQQLPWGDPDLQGIWTSATITTLQRPEEIEELVLTEAQAEALEKFGEEALASIDDLPEGDLKAGENVGGYNAFWVDPGTRVLRVKGEPRSSIIVEPEDGQVPYTLMGCGRFYWNGYKMLNRHDNPEERPLGERCTVGFGSTGGPPMLPVLYNNNYQFIQTPGQVMILVEMNHNVRNIRLGGEPLPAAIRPWLGDSIGHWEGDTLVVRTTQFHPQQNLLAAIKHQFYMTRDSVVEERFTRIGESEILYQFTVTDDSIYRRPWKGEMTLRATDGPIYEYACHEGNYALPNILAGARQEEES
jgi:hypothetical protein